MNKDKLKDEIFLGVVVDNNDPKKLGRCKIKVFQVFDKLGDIDIPWAMPWKDLNGNEFSVPDIGKYVSVVFDQGNKYTPEYIYAQNFNINLERKLQSLSGENYTSMRALMFDHSTQIYRNQEEGLKIDHEYSNINLDKYGNIQLNLRDNNSVITLGSKDAAENIVLGTTFMNWFDDLLEALIGVEGGAYLTPSGAPVIAGPKLTEVLMRYNTLRDSFLSDHVKAPANSNVIAQTRDYINQRGDSEFASILPASPQPVSIITDQLTGSSSKYEFDSNSVNNPADLSSIDPSDYPEPNIIVRASNKVGANYYPGDKSFRSKYKNAHIPIQAMLPIPSPIKSLARYGGKFLLHPEAANQWCEMDKEAKKAGIVWTVSSAYRDLEHQIGIKSKAAAKPGSSPHGWGGAVDISELYRAVGGSINARVNENCRRTNKIFLWLDQNGPKFGWYNPWRLRDQLGTQEECWHFEYWGPNVVY